MSGWDELSYTAVTPRASLQSDANNNIKWKWEIQGSLPFSGLRLAAITSPRIYRTALLPPLLSNLPDKSKHRCHFKSKLESMLGFWKKPTVRKYCGQCDGWLTKHRRLEKVLQLMKTKGQPWLMMIVVLGVLKLLVTPADPSATDDWWWWWRSL